MTKRIRFSTTETITRIYEVDAPDDFHECDLIFMTDAAVELTIDGDVEILDGDEEYRPHTY